MPAPSTPTNFLLQTGNRQNYLSWNITPTAITYVVNRSTDGVNFASVASPSVTNYLDTAVLIGVQYFYQIAATNGSGTSPFTVSQSIVPAPTAEMSLGQLRLQAQQRADRVNSNFVTVPEWNSYIVNSMYELYDLLIGVYEDLYLAPSAGFRTVANQADYPLPDGALTFLDENQNSFVAPPFYKLMGVDLGLQTSSNAYVDVDKFNFKARNNFVYPNTASTIYGVFNLRYRVMGNLLKFIPVPSSGQPMKIWYVPRLQQLLKDTDLTDSGISGWLEYVIVDAAIKALQKEESDVSVLMIQKMALQKRIEEMASNRDAGAPDTITDVRNSGGWGFNGPFDGFKGGY